MILKQLVDFQANRSEAIRWQEELVNDLVQLRQALNLGHIEVARRITNDMEWTLSQMRELNGIQEG